MDFAFSSKTKIAICSLLLSVLLVGCGGDKYADIKSWMAEVKARPAGGIDPIPTYPPYESFSYQAMAMRAPFDRPVKVKDVANVVAGGSTVKPDANRVKEALEKFGIDDLSMVGTYKKGNTLWALVNDGRGGVHPVTEGNYLGRNHGKIVELVDDQVLLVEIVPNGAGAWIERPRTIKLRSK
ncbi:MAG: pilus assembly protein PilP [Pseudomonadales bacterium]